jgi:DNA replication licensing factor MCM3
LLNSPFDYTLAFDTALKNVIKTLPNRPRHELDDEVMYYCAFVGSFGEFACNPRTLSSSHLNHMVALEGIVTKCSLVRPKVIKSMHYSEIGNKFVSREYKDQTMTVGATTSSVYPTEDEDGNPVSITVEHNAELILMIHSLSRNMVTPPTAITRLSPSKRCRSEHLPVSYLAV